MRRRWGWARPAGRRGAMRFVLGDVCAKPLSGGGCSPPRPLACGRPPSRPVRHEAWWRRQRRLWRRPLRARPAIVERRGRLVRKLLRLPAGTGRRHRRLTPRSNVSTRDISSSVRLGRSAKGPEGLPDACGHPGGLSSRRGARTWLEGGRAATLDRRVSAVGRSDRRSAVERSDGRSVTRSVGRADEQSDNRTVVGLAVNRTSGGSVGHPDGRSGGWSGGRRSGST